MSNNKFDRQIQTDTITDVLEDIQKEQSLVVYNDDVNTFDHVIESLIDVCDHTPEQAEQCSLLIHFKGKSSVHHGDFDKLHPMKAALNSRSIEAVIE